jgi:hypothetical protein
MSRFRVTASMVLTQKTNVGIQASGGHEPDPEKSATYLFAFLDVLGFERLLGDIGLEKVHSLYVELLEQALRPESEEKPWSRSNSIVQNHVVPALMWLPIHTAYFSDSLMLWVHFHPGHVGEFLSRCSRVFCKALELGIPLRGAVTIGSAVFHKEQGIYLGEPLVEAARLEAKQNWVGVALGASFKSESIRIPIPPEAVFQYSPPLKPGGEELFSGLVLDWPRVWRESYSSSSAVEKLSSLCTEALPEHLKQRYHAASEFYAESEAHKDWFIPQGFTVEKAYRDRDAPHRAPLPHHAAYGSVLRDSADQAESDPGEHKSK